VSRDVAISQHFLSSADLGSRLAFKDQDQKRLSQKLCRKS